MKKLFVIPCVLLLYILASCGNDMASKPKEKSEPSKQTSSVTKKETPKPQTKLKDENPQNLKIPVLMYHSINPEKKNNLIVPPHEFEAQMKWLKDNHYTTIGLSELAKLLQTGKDVPEKPIVITFDDGYQDNYTNAYPVLKKYHFKANIFVITSKIGAENHFDEKAMKEMSQNGIEMDSHTVTHQELNHMSYRSQLEELKNSKATIVNITGKSVESICYPVGRFNEDTKKAAKSAGYEMGFTTQHGYANKNKGMYTLPRLRVSPGAKMAQILQ